MSKNTKTETTIKFYVKGRTSVRDAVSVEHQTELDDKFSVVFRADARGTWLNRKQIKLLRNYLTDLLRTWQ